MQIMETANIKQEKTEIQCVKGKDGNCIVSKPCDRGVKKRCIDGKLSGTQCACKDSIDYQEN